MRHGNTRARLGAVTAAGLILALAACSNLNTREQRALSGGAIGAGAGALLGVLTGGALVGAAIGAGSGAAIGALTETDGGAEGSKAD